MDFNEYQEKASETDQSSDVKGDGADALLIPLLGMAGETGTLLSEFKKKHRDKDSYEGFPERAEEELGDVLWYVASVATHLGLSMSKIAERNLRKTQERWPIPGEILEANYHDAGYPGTEQLPRKFQVEVLDQGETLKAKMLLLPERTTLGDELTNNAYDDDGYRFHDVFHLAHVAVLGWSPVIRKLMKRKRKSRPEIDDVEDGARAMIIEELIVAFVYSNASGKKYYDGIKNLDSELLWTIKRLVSGLEANKCLVKEWEQAILQGYVAFRVLLEKKRAILEIDIESKTLKVIG